MPRIPGKKINKEVMQMCPELKEGICEIAGIEPEEVACADEDCCYSSEWDKCRVYISQFFPEVSETLSGVA